MTYEQAGVSIRAQDDAIARFKAAVEATHGPEVVAGVGAFGAAFAPKLAGLAEPVLVSSTDSLGTKALLHARCGTHEWAGRDVVGCVVNDVLCSGARPLYFLDYVGLHRVEPERVAALVGGVAAGCREIGCALIGGELAEMRDVYQPGDFDLVGFAVGLADRRAMLGPERVTAGSKLIGLASHGVHCNGFSLVRRALADWPLERWGEPVAELGGSLRDALLRPTRCYANEMAALAGRFELQAAAHISGGGLIDNVPRVIPDGLTAVVDRRRIKVPPLFAIIQRHGGIAEDEMWHVFNMGIGFVVVVRADEGEAMLRFSTDQGWNPTLIGEVVQAGAGPRFAWA